MPRIRNYQSTAAVAAEQKPQQHAGETRPTFSVEAKLRYLRSLKKIAAQKLPLTAVTQAATPRASKSTPEKVPERPQPIYAERGQARVQALRMVWPIMCRRLEGLPDISATQLIDELCIQLPGLLLEIKGVL